MDLNATIDELQKIFGTVFGPGVVLRTQLDPALNRIRGDAQKIQSVLVNLLMQARDVIPSKSEVVLCTTNMVVDPAAAASMHLAPGKYARLDLLLSGRIETESVREAVEQLRGTITTTATPEQGVTVTLALPQNGGAD